jgi:C-terminal processing protease CtpA/Prc
VIWFAFRPGYIQRPFNRAGLRAVKDDAHAFRVVLIVPGSPASLAGLAPDDRIVAVDGTPAEQLSGRNLGDKFIQAVWTNVTLTTMDKGGIARTVAVTLLEMLP